MTLWRIAVRLLFLPIVVAGFLVVGLGAMVMFAGVQSIRFLTGEQC